METNQAIAVIWGMTLVAAALSDLRSFRISNLFPVTLILVFLAAHGLAGFPDALWQNLFHFLLALIVGMALFGKGWIGGGDAKLYAAAALSFGWSGAVALIFLTGVAGLFLAIAFVAARLLGLRKQVSKKDRRIPYGVAIAAGAFMTAAWSGWDRIFPAFSL